MALSFGLAQRAAAQRAPADSAAFLWERALELLQGGGTARLPSAVMLLRESSALFASAGLSAEAGDALTMVGAVFQRTGRPDSALRYLRQALPLCRAAGDANREVIAVNNIGAVFDDLGWSDSAVAFYRLNLAMHRADSNRALEAATLARIANSYGRVGRYDSALLAYRAALQICHAFGDSSAEATTLNNIGEVLRRTRQADSALVFFRAARRIAHALGDPAGEGDALAGIGRAYAFMGRLDSALDYYRAALPMKRYAERYAGEPGAEGVTLDDIGLAFQEMGQPDSALAYFRAALPLMRAVPDRRGEGIMLGRIGAVLAGVFRLDSALAYLRTALAIHLATEDLREQAVSLNGIGAVFLQLDRRDSALVYLRAALPGFRAVGDSSGEAATLANIGNIYLSIDQLDSALAFERAALAIVRAKGTLSVEADLEADLLTNIGAVYVHTGQPDSALAYYRAALALARAHGGQDDSTSVVSALDRIGWVYQMVPAFRSLSRAVALYDTVATLLARMRARAGSEASRISFAEAQMGLSPAWALAWLGREGEVGALVSARSALAAVERGRAQALLDLLRRTADSAQGVAGVGSYLTRPGADLAVEAESLVAPLRRTRTAALSYLVTDSDTLVIWLVTPAGEVRVAGRVAVSADTLAAWVAALRRDLGADSARGAMARAGGGQPVDQEVTRGLGVEAPRSRPVGQAAAMLARWLVPAEVLGAVPAGTELVIVPHGVLGLVPFALLPVGDTLLGLRNALRHAPSLASLRAVDSEGGRLPTGAARRQALRGALVVGNPRMPEVAGEEGLQVRLRALPAAEQEARRVAARVGVGVLVGARATESAVRARLGAAPLVHLATHGLAHASEARVRSSYVALAADSLNDGLLTLGELVDDPALGLRAELVVLSACQTGLGDLKQAEGTVGLQRGLLARGARSVLVSLWSVDDEATAALMEGFYRHWLDDGDGPSKAEALRRAQGDVRGYRDAEGGRPWVEPQYWAAFQLVGAR